MTSVKPPTVRFSGYRYHEKNKPELFLPGFQNADKVEAEILSSPEAGLSTMTRASLKRDGSGQYWALNGDQNLKPGAAYRFRAKDVNGKDIPVPLDFLETVEIKNGDKTDTFNHIALHDANTPQKSSVFADIYADSILTEEQIKALDEQERKRLKWEGGLPDKRLPVLPMRTHFNKFNKVTFVQKTFDEMLNDKEFDQEVFKEKGYQPGNAAVHGYEAGLNQLVPELRNRGVSAILFKPFIGGDNLSSHRYWTSDPYILNDTFRNKTSFRNSLDLMLKNGMKVFADGAFVNQGMNGVQVMSNLRNTTNSPYWKNWFHFGNHETDDPKKLPSLAQEPYKFGVLPTKTVNGRSEINYDAFAVRFTNNPAGDNYDARKPTFLELYDPRLENENGEPKPEAERVKAFDLKNGKSSVQKYRFPVDPKQYREKVKAGDRGMHPNAKFLDWDNFSLTVPSADDSSRKWAGQIDVALMNTESEEVVNYLKGAVNYWSRMVMNHYTNTVALSMQDAKRRSGGNASLEAILDAVTQSKDNPDGVLPPTTHPVDIIGSEKVKKFAEAKRDFEADKTGGAFAKALLQNVPINTLQLPILFKANLNDPKFLEAQKLRTGKFANFMEDRFLGLIDIPYVGKPFEWLSNLIFSPRLEKAVGRKMQQVFDELSENGGASDKLRYKEIQSIVADQLGEKFYVSLLTGKSLKDSAKLIQNPDDLEQAFYDSVPPSLVQASPQEAARRMPALLRKRLRELNHSGPNNAPSLKTQVREEIERIVKNLDPSLVSLASNVLKEREFGLNWRIDAAKDVADMDEVRNTPDDEKAREKFREKVKYLNEFWGEKLGDAMRSVFPKSSVIAELTDFGELARDGKDGTEGQAQLRNLFSKNTFTSMPNMAHTYSPLLQLVHYAQRPDEFGASVLTPGKFIQDNLRKMTQEVPLFAQRNFQNLTASHDYSTTSHALMVNPVLFNQDRDKQAGLMEFMDQGIHELQRMACFANEREALKKSLGIQDDQKLAALFDDLKKWIQPASNATIAGDIARKNPGWPEKIYNKDSKASLWDKKTPPSEHYLRGPVPQDFKDQFASQAIGLWHDRLDPKEGVWSNERSRLRKLALHSPALISADATRRQAAINAIQSNLEKRMKESGEAKAMRGVINNAVVELAETDAVAQNPEVQKVIWAGLNDAIEEWGTHFGYQQLDTALNHVFEKAEADGKLTKAGLDRPAIEKLKLGIYNTALKPVLAKQERIFAIQNALPGNPSVYLPDLFVQGGSELTKNIYGQNRGIIRADKLMEKNTDFSNYLDRVGNIFKSREDLAVLNDGIIIPVETNDAHGILPIVRDNGTDQAIVLIDTGKRNVKDGEAIKPMDTDSKSNQYSNVEGHWTETRTMESIKLKSPYLQPDTLYRDKISGEEFKINKAGELVKVANGHEVPNFEVKANRILVRV